MHPLESTLAAEETSLQERVERVRQGRGALRPGSTYRFQFNRDFTLDDALALVPYLRALGVTHIYASPLLRARAGSTHGYDIANHNQINPELGGEESLTRLTEALRAHGMGLVLDTVPNHMGVGKGDNPWWQDVMRHGQASEFADFFDIDWAPLKPELRNKVLLPILGSQYGAELEAGHIQLQFDGEGGFRIAYFDNRLPLDPQSLPQILLTLPGESSPVELQAVIRGMSGLPPHWETRPERVQQRRADAPRLRAEMLRIIAEHPPLRQAVEARLRQMNGTPGSPASFDALHNLLEAQAYRLAHWRVSGEEINYRRFFDVNDLVGLRMENPRVFAETHRLLRRLMAQGQIDGVRIDHCDGLLNPRQYLIRLQMLYYAARCCGPEPQGKTSDNGIELEVQQSLSPEQRVIPAFYCLVEKILEPGESLPAEWPVDGTSGYEFIRQVNGLFIQGNNEAAITRAYHRFLGKDVDFEQLLYNSKKVVMHTSLASEVNVLAHLLDEISITDRHARDFTRKTLRDAIRETIACFPVYRSYIDERGEIFPRDREYIDLAIERAKGLNAGTASMVFDFLSATLLTEKPAAPDLAYRRKLHFTLKFQQLTGPVMAKGLEDTAFYVYNRFLSNNEVGCVPEVFSTSVADFHRANLHRLEEWPNAMLATSTHDTKRSEDVRARLNVLSEIPGDWFAKASNWRRLNERFRITLPDGRVVPDANEEYLLYQTLVGAWPLAMQRADERAEFTRRIQQYMDKAIHEAKANVSWINPDPLYTEAVREFIARILMPGERGRSNFFLKRIEAFLPAVQFFGAINSVAQTLLKLTSPGVPDLYQGTELFDFSLVDPDNRRAVDFATRADLLERLRGKAAGEAQDTRIDGADLMRHYADGRIKLWTIAQALNLRRAQAELFREGRYEPLEARGEKAEHLCAFARVRPGIMSITAVPRFTYTLMKGAMTPPLGEVWGKTGLQLGNEMPTSFYNVLTGQRIHAADGALAMRDVFADLPVALLVTDQD